MRPFLMASLKSDRQVSKMYRIPFWAAYARWHWDGRLKLPHVSQVGDKLLGLDLVGLRRTGLFAHEVFEMLGGCPVPSNRGVGRGEHLFVVIQEASAKFNDGDRPEGRGGWCLGYQLGIGLSSYLFGFLT